MPAEPLWGEEYRNRVFVRRAPCKGKEGKTGDACRLALPPLRSIPKGEKTKFILLLRRKRGRRKKGDQATPRKRNGALGIKKGKGEMIATFSPGEKKGELSTGEKTHLRPPDSIKNEFFWQRPSPFRGKKKRERKRGTKTSNAMGGGGVGGGGGGGGGGGKLQLDHGGPDPERERTQAYPS